MATASETPERLWNRDMALTTAEEVAALAAAARLEQVTFSLPQHHTGAHSACTTRSAQGWRGNTLSQCLLCGAWRPHCPHRQPGSTQLPRHALAKTTRQVCRWVVSYGCSRRHPQSVVPHLRQRTAAQARGKREWALPEDFQLRFENEAAELFVGGVYVRLFLRDPRFPLRSPKVRRAPPHGLLCAAH